MFALGVILVDVGKALLAVGWLPRPSLPGSALDPPVDRDWLAVACATAVVAGHVYPVWYEFRGGKGAATLIGAVARARAARAGAGARRVAALRSC